MRSVRASGCSAPHCRDPNSNNTVGEASVDGDAVASDGGRGRMTVHHLHLPQSWTLRILLFEKIFTSLLDRPRSSYGPRLDYSRLSCGYTTRISMRTYNRIAYEIYSVMLFYRETSLGF